MTGAVFLVPKWETVLSSGSAKNVNSDDVGMKMLY